MNRNIKEQIQQAGRVTADVRTSYFKGCGFKDIRKWMGNNGLDPHTAIELESTEIAIVTPKGLMMQVRATDHNQLGMWGGVLQEGETPRKGAVRELYEETGLIVSEDDLEYVEEDDHEHKYDNGDKAIFHSYRYKLVISYIPVITTDEDTAGIFYLPHTVLAHQYDFAARMLGEK